MAKSGTSGIFHSVPGGVKPSKGSSAKTYVPAGSGSRPTRSTMPIESSAPQDPLTMGRYSKSGALK